MPTPTPRNCPTHFGMHDMPCRKGCGDICIAAAPEKVNAALIAAEYALEAWQNVFGTSQLTHANARLEAAESRARLAEEDAERYQFLRRSGDLDCPHVYGPDDDCIIDGDELDAAIDQARKDKSHD